MHETGLFRYAREEKGMERRVRLEENTKWFSGEEVSGGRGSYFAFFCVSFSSPPRSPFYPVVLSSALKLQLTPEVFNALVYSAYRS